MKNIWSYILHKLGYQKSVGDRQTDQLGPLIELRFAKVMQVFIWGEMFLRKKRTILLTAHIVTSS